MIQMHIKKVWDKKTCHYKSIFSFLTHLAKIFSKIAQAKKLFEK
jgi:hypothetical protein